MGTLTGFAVGYLLGVQQGPEGHAKLRQAWETITTSPEVKQVLDKVPGLLEMATTGIAGPLAALLSGDSSKLGDTLKAVTGSAAWQSVSSSPQVAPLLENGRTLLQGLVERGMEMLTTRGGNGVDRG